MGKLMEPGVIRAARKTATVTKYLNTFLTEEDTRVEDSLATLVIALADHIEAVEEASKYEYVLKHFRKGLPWGGIIQEDDWGTLEEAKENLERCQKLHPGADYRIVRRRIAGEPEVYVEP